MIRTLVALSLVASFTVITAACSDDEPYCLPVSVSELSGEAVETTVERSDGCR